MHQYWTLTMTRCKGLAHGAFLISNVKFTYILTFWKLLFQPHGSWLPMMHVISVYIIWRSITTWLTTYFKRVELNSWGNWNYFEKINFICFKSILNFFLQIFFLFCQNFGHLSCGLLCPINCHDWGQYNSEYYINFVIYHQCVTNLKGFIE